MPQQQDALRPAVPLPSTGTLTTNTAAGVSVPLRTVSEGMNYALTSLEITTDAPASNPVLVQVQVGGTVVLSALVNNVTPLRWTNAQQPVEAVSGQQVQLLAGKTSVVQNLAYNVGQIEY